VRADVRRGDPKADGGRDAVEPLALTHLDEVFVKINGDLHYLWRAVDHEGDGSQTFAVRISVAFASDGIAICRWVGLCCANAAKDSACESSLLDRLYEQTEAPHLPHLELA
jgi:hypothetical protein